MNIRIKLIYYLATTILLPVIVGAVGLTILQARGGQLVSIHDSSMGPRLSKGDVLITMPIKPANIEAGQIIAFMDPHNNNKQIARRVSAIDIKRGFVQTINDSDPSSAQRISFESILGRALTFAPKLGFVYDILHTPIGLILAVYLPTLMIVVAEVYRLIVLSPFTGNLLDYKYEPKRSKI